MKTLLKILIALLIVLAISYASEVLGPAMQNDGVDQMNGDMSEQTGSQAGEWKTKYIHPVEWPPQVTTVDQAFSCAKAVSTTTPTMFDSPIFVGSQAVQKTIGDTTYCITASSEGAAGSIYTTYTYSFAAPEDAGKTKSLEFTLRSVQCGLRGTRKDGLRN